VPVAGLAFAVLVVGIGLLVKVGALRDNQIASAGWKAQECDSKKSEKTPNSEIIQNEETFKVILESDSVASGGGD